MLSMRAFLGEINDWKLGLKRIHNVRKEGETGSSATVGRASSGTTSV